MDWPGFVADAPSAFLLVLTTPLHSSNRNVTLKKKTVKLVFTSSRDSSTTPEAAAPSLVS